MLKPSQQPMILRMDQRYRKLSESYGKHDHTSSCCQKGKLERLDIKKVERCRCFGAELLVFSILRKHTLLHVCFTCFPGFCPEVAVFHWYCNVFLSRGVIRTTCTLFKKNNIHLTKKVHTRFEKNKLTHTGAFQQIGDNRFFPWPQNEITISDPIIENWDQMCSQVTEISTITQSNYGGKNPAIRRTSALEQLQKLGLELTC